MFALQKVAVEAGTPLNHVVDIHPQDDALKVDDAECKRWLCNRAKNIQQAVRGRGKTPRQTAVPCVTVYEKRLGKDLHAHQWLHVAPGNDALERFDDGLEVYVHESHANTADYLTKARLPVGDAATEANYPHKRQGGQAAIRGARISFNADAKALLAVKPKPAPVAAAAAASPATVDAPIMEPRSHPGWNFELATQAEPPQLELFDAAETPIIDIRSMIEAFRIERNMPQKQVARILGMKQPHYSNAVVRRHDPLGAYARNRALEWINNIAA